MGSEIYISPDSAENLYYSDAQKNGEVVNVNFRFQKKGSSF